MQELKMVKAIEEVALEEGHVGPASVASWVTQENIRKARKRYSEYEPIEVTVCHICGETVEIDGEYWDKYPNGSQMHLDQLRAEHACHRPLP